MGLSNLDSCDCLSIETERRPQVIGSICLCWSTGMPPVNVLPIRREGAGEVRLQNCVSAGRQSLGERLVLLPAVDLNVCHLINWGST